MSPQEENDNDKYHVDVVECEYDPSGIHGISSSSSRIDVSKQAYPSTSVRKVEFKESVNPEPFLMPLPQAEGDTTLNMPVEATPENKPEEVIPEDRPCTASMLTQTLGFLDDICKMPRANEEPKNPLPPPPPHWGEVPWQEEETSIFPSSVQSTEYSRSLFTESDGTSNVFQSVDDVTIPPDSFPDDEGDDHENYEVVLDSTLLGSPPPSPKRNFFSSVPKEEPRKKKKKRSLLKRLFTVRKKKPREVLSVGEDQGQHDIDESYLQEEDEQEDFVEESQGDEPQAMQVESSEGEEHNFDPPELAEDSSTQAVFTQEPPIPQKEEYRYTGMSDPSIPKNPHAIGHSRSAPPAFRSRSPVDDVFAKLGSLFSSLDPLGQMMVEEEKKDDDPTNNDVGPEDESEDHATKPVVPEEEIDVEPNKDIVVEPIPTEDTTTKADKKSRPLLGGFAKKIRSFTSRDEKKDSEGDLEQNHDQKIHKKKRLWKSTLDPNTGRTYWYNRVTRVSTFDPPPEALEEAAEIEAQAQQQTEIEHRVVTPEKTEKVELAEKEPPKPKKKPRSLWKAVVDKNSGRTYYYHRKTRETTWHMPEELKRLEEETKEEPLKQPDPPAKEDPPAVILAEVSAESQADLVKNIQLGGGSSFEEMEEKEAQADKRKEVQRLLNSLTPPDPRDINDLMKEYAGREDVLLKQLRDQVESQPFDEPFVEITAIPNSSPTRLSSRTTTFMSKASATTKSSTITDKTERIRNTMVKSKFEPINETQSISTSISSHKGDDNVLHVSLPSIGRVVPRERELKVEELSRSRVAAETFDMAGRVVRRHRSNPDDDENLNNYYEDNEGDMYCGDSVSALSENDTDFAHRKENFEQARRRALDDAIEREDWDLAAALSEGIRYANTTGDYARAHSSWNQSELDKFIAQNDWGAVKSYIARMRNNAKKEGHSVVPSAGVDKRVGSRSQLQHKLFVSDTSWTSDSYDSEEEEESFDSEFS